MHIFLPNQCMFCRKPAGYDKDLCPLCEKNIPFTKKAFDFPEGSSEKVKISRLYVPFYYEMGVENAIQDLKFNDNLLNARKLGGFMADCLQTFAEGIHFDLLLPVPLYSKDKRERGYNQSEELAEWVSKKAGIPVNQKTLRKIKETKSQHLLTERERYYNLAGAFCVTAPEEIAGRHILLVDDVFTTGSTMKECASALLQAGASCVSGLAAARTRNIAK